MVEIRKKTERRKTMESKVLNIANKLFENATALSNDNFMVARTALDLASAMAQAILVTQDKVDLR